MQPRDGNDILRENGADDARNAFDGNLTAYIPEHEEPEYRDVPEREDPLSFSKAMASKIKLVAYTPVDPKTLPPRQWLYGSHLIRGFVSGRVAAGGVGKTSLSIAETLAMVTGKSLLGIPVKDPLRVYLWNGEDPLEELIRRFEAARQFYRITPEDIGGRFFPASGRDTEIKTAVAVRGGSGVEILEPVVSALVQEFRDNKIDVAIFDPFVSSHSVNENDNGQIDAVVKQWGKVASAANSENGGCGIDLIHHIRKGHGGQERSIDDARGASSLMAAMRSVDLLVRMTDGEAAKMLIPIEDAWRFSRIADGKANMAPPASKAVWFRMESVHLGNGDDGGPGDNVGVTTLFRKPPIFDGIGKDKIVRLMTALRGATPESWRHNQQANEWVGHLVGEHLEIDVGESGQKDLHDGEKANRKRVAAMVNAWLDSGAMRLRDEKDKKGTLRKCVVLGNWFQALK